MSRSFSSSLRRLVLGLLVLFPLTLAAAPYESLANLDPAAWRLLPQVQVHLAGIYLNEVVENSLTPLPHLRLAAAPPLGRAITLTRFQIAELVRKTEPELVPTNWCGAMQVRVTRRTRWLEEVETKERLVTVLQRDFVKERGDLELRFTRPWQNALIADEAFTLNVVDLPTMGVTPNFIVRFELRSGDAVLGSWQVPVQARLWRDVWVAASPLRRGQLLRTADVAKERRDILVCRDALGTLDRDDASLELAENLPAGMPLTARSLRPRPVVQRGKLVDAILQDGALTISVKAEVLEDGIPGQMVRARNLKTKHEFLGKVQNEETISVAL
jgi:flagella basal body P-ring formation protein FlgA